MKLKSTVMVSFLLLIVFFVAQSFYYHYKRKSSPLAAQSPFKSGSRSVALCGVAFNPDEAIPDIPALKGWGNYSFKITTNSDSTQYYFNQGLSLYYAFHTIEAIASFEKATHFDPECAMAWYGKSLAMGPTINYPNGYAPPADAEAASLRSGLFTAKCTPLENALITAMQKRYSIDTTISVHQLRVSYADAMRLVYSKFPKNADVISLYADALLLLHPWDLYGHDFSPKPWTPQICALLKEALVLNPKHPGANHYFIHAVEASATPQLALNSAHFLDTLMPLVSHITHMPSHIYIRTGDYQRGIRDNEVAVAGYETYTKAYKPVAEGAVLYQMHNMHLRINCAQMGGNYAIANHGSNSLRAVIPLPYLSLQGGDGNFFQYIYMQPVFTAARFGKWDDILKSQPITGGAYTGAILNFAKGLAWCAKADVVKAQSELDMLGGKLRDSSSLKAKIDNFSSAYESITVAQLILKGKIAETQKHYADAISILKQAVVAEDNLIYNEPRDWPIPARHYLGEMLLKTGKYTDAITVLNKDLTINPANGWALTGLRTAYQHTGNSKELTKVNQQLKGAWKIKDVPIANPVF
ncbi:tetratricopeptide repeat protein [Mucilaginibacter agri]|uniref:Tetratricopeptide repeat protein n=1 Tax=Mucilaginibacter agri TaxID=2695265 RepID=A0A966DVQ0_9SPHI|nr:hypothetical protein [Mucilaginibacter agri]NCD71677.1 hypothetical protein [Mucilaginibacter agri]